MRFLEDRYRGLYLTMLATFAAFGVTLTLLGAALPKIMDQFGWSKIEAGVVGAGLFVGYFVTTLAAGVLVHRLGPKRVAIIGLGLWAAGLSGLGTAPSVMLNLAMNVLIGVGHGCVEVVVNFGVVRMERNGQSRLMNLAHAAFCIGAVVGPAVVGLLVGAGADWQWVCRAMAGVSVVLAVVYAVQPFSRLGSWGAGEEGHPRLREFLKHPLLILCSLVLFLYVGAELGTSTWLGVYAVKVVGADASMGAYMVSIFWVGLLTGRVGLSYGYHGRRQAELLVVLSVCCSVAMLGALAAGSVWSVGAAFFLTGLGYSAIYPVVVALVGARFVRGQGMAIGVIATGGGVGAFVIPMAMASLSEWRGVRTGFFFYAAVNVLMVILSIGVVCWVRAQRRREAVDPAGPDAS